MLADNDLTPSFLEYRRLIKLIIWRNPLPRGGHLVLKSPQNSRDVDQFARAFPEARFVFSHHDPFRACVSVCTLAEHINAWMCASTSNDLWRPGGPA